MKSALNIIQTMRLIKAEGICRTVILIDPNTDKITKEIISVNECLSYMAGLVKLAEELAMDAVSSKELSQKSWKVLKYLRRFTKETKQDAIGVKI